MADFTDSLEKILLGAPRGILLDPEDRERTAVSIIPRGATFAVTLSRPDSDRVSYSSEELEARIKFSLGGRRLMKQATG